MTVYLLQFLNGIGIGMIYFLVAVGLTVIFGIMRFVNFAHGAFYLLGAYLCYSCVAVTGSFWPALIIGPALVAALAWCAERLFVNRLYSLPHTYQILVTFGLALVIQEAVIILWGSVGQNVSAPDSLGGVVFLGSFAYPKYRLFVIALAALLAIGLWVLLDRTRYGAVIRAGTESTEMVALLGIDIYAVFAYTFALGAALAALAGVLAAPIRGAEPFMGLEALAIGFAIVVIGGMGSFTGALVGSLLVGIVQSLMSSLWAEGAGIMVYVAMALVILMRPQGLLGRA